MPTRFFTAEQAAQKVFTLLNHIDSIFTAEQAAQKNIPTTCKMSWNFTAEQAAQKNTTRDSKDKDASPPNRRLRKRLNSV